MIILTNKIELNVRTKDNDETRLSNIPAGSRLKYDRQSSGYHAYYEIHTYSLFCSYKEKDIIISCSKYVGGKEPKLSRYNIKQNSENARDYFWSEVFNEDFPE